MLDRDAEDVQAAPATEGDELSEQFERLDLSPRCLRDKLQDFTLLLKNPRQDEQAIKIKEQCIYRLANAFAETPQLNSVVNLLKENGDFFSAIPKARTAKIVRNILNIVATGPDSVPIQIELCEDIVEWCKAEKRTFLRQRIEAKLATLLLEQRKPTKALEVIDKLLPELRKLGDKQMLTEVHLTEARTYHALQNIPKSKASLTASRTAANSIYVVPLLQAEIDQMSGTLLCEEGDYSTAYSYFLEAFDAYDQSGSTKAAVACLKYMILSKVLKEAAHEVPALLASKIGMKHSGKDLEAMAAVARAAKEFSLEKFSEVVSSFNEHLSHDDLIAHHLDLLYDKMLEANLLKIIHPYSAVEIAHIAKLIKLSQPQVVHKLSQMILDHKFQGILDQGRGHLIIYDKSMQDSTFTRGVEVITNMGDVVEALSARAKGLSRSSL